MCQFIESICCEDGRAKLLNLHQARLEKTFSNFYPHESSLDLAKIVSNIPADGKYKCRLVYNAKTYTMNYLPYQAKIVDSLQIVHSENLQYKFKSNNREDLDNLYHMRKEADDIIIINNGLVTDSYYANLLFYDGNEWWTPENPLLEGVKREFLLSVNLVKTKRIYEHDLNSFTKVSLINAMLDIGEVEVPVENLVF